MQPASKRRAPRKQSKAADDPRHAGPAALDGKKGAERKARSARILAQLKGLTPEEFARRGPRVVLDDSELIVDVGNGQTVRIPSQEAVDKDLSALTDLAHRLVERARLTRAPWLVSMAHILGAVASALHAGDLDALDVPHRWARKRMKAGGSYLTTASGESVQATLSSFYVPVADSENRVIANPLPPGYDLLRGVLAPLLRASRAAGRSLSDATEVVVSSMRTAFPGLASLNDPALDYEAATEQLFQRVAPQLVALSKRYESATAEDAADTIAEELVRIELLLSGRTAHEAERELGSFLKMRSRRRASEK